MLEEILSDGFSKVSASNQSLFSTEYNYEDILKNYNQHVESWKRMTDAQRGEFESKLVKFLRWKDAEDPRDEKFITSKHYSLMKREIDSRLGVESQIQTLPIDAIDLENSALELIESIENTEHIKDLYKVRKITTGSKQNSGINSIEAAKIKNCFSQGKELYLAGRNGSLMVKPLNFFYSLTAYSYGIVILNNPIRYNKGNLPGSHGMSYLPDKIQVQFGGDVARGTFSGLVTSFPTQTIRNRLLSVTQDCIESVMEFYNTKFTVSPGLLISMIPEMSDYYFLITGQHSRAHPLEIVNANDLRSLKWEFQIGNGEHKPSLDGVRQSFPGFQVSERHGKYVVQVPATEAKNIKACMYTDIRGNFWYIDNPFFPIILPEVCVHFLISSIFSNIMRYRPDGWGNVLLNELNSNISLGTRHYFSAFERKKFLIVLRSTSKYMPYVV